MTESFVCYRQEIFTTSLNSHIFCPICLQAKLALTNILVLTKYRKRKKLTVIRLALSYRKHPYSRRKDVKQDSKEWNGGARQLANSIITETSRSYCELYILAGPALFIYTCHAHRAEEFPSRDAFTWRDDKSRSVTVIQRHILECFIWMQLLTRYSRQSQPKTKISSIISHSKGILYKTDYFLQAIGHQIAKS